MKHDGPVRSLFVFAAICGLASTWPAAAADEPAAGRLRVESFHWGFDGRVVPGEFNPLALVILNPSATPLEGTLELVRLRAMYWEVDTRLLQPMFVSAHARRTIRFYPYVIGAFDSWQLVWVDPAGTRHVINDEPWRPLAGTAAVVELVDRDETVRRRGRLKRFPEQLFPTASTATSGLHGVVIDHVPSWETPRRLAFFDWVHRGGVVHLVKGPGGRWPQFSGAWAGLDPERGGRLGSGRVVRHELSAADLDPSTITPENTSDEPRGRRSLANGLGTLFDTVDDDALFAALRSMTRPVRNWVLIYLSALAYLAMLFPGCLALSRRGLDYRLVLAALLGVVGLFSTLFALVGRRSDTRGMTIRSVAVARQLPGGALDVTGWVDAAVTSSGRYRFTVDGTGRLYSTAQDLEQLTGTISSGRAAELAVEIPPYSSRTFIYRSRLEDGGFDVAIRNMLSTPVRLESLELEFDEKFPAKTLSIAVLDGRRLYSMVRSGRRLRLGMVLGSIEALSTFGPTGRLPRRFDPTFDEYQGVENTMHQLFHPVVLRSLGLRSSRDLSSFALPPDRLRLFVYAPLPGSMMVRVAETVDTADQSGCVMYVIDLPRPGAS